MNQLYSLREELISRNKTALTVMDLNDSKIQEFHAKNIDKFKRVIAPFDITPTFYNLSIEQIKPLTAIRNKIKHYELIVLQGHI